MGERDCNCIRSAAVPELPLCVVQRTSRLRNDNVAWSNNEQNGQPLVPRDLICIAQQVQLAGQCWSLSTRVRLRWACR